MLTFLSTDSVDYWLFALRLSVNIYDGVERSLLVVIKLCWDDCEYRYGCNKCIVGEGKGASIITTNNY